MSIAAPNNLNAIRSKVRKLTGTPSTTQLDDVTIDQYINTFYYYDFPEHLRTLTLRTSYTFYTQPYVDVYAFDRQAYNDVIPPVYIAGYQTFYTQSREQFYRVWPRLEFIEQVATGDGGAGPYTFTCTQTPFLRGYHWQTNNQLDSQFLISGIGPAGNSIIARDDGIGGLVDEDGNALTGSINYVTGVGTVTFNSVIAAGNEINAQYIPEQPARPLAMMFYGDNFFLRPIPDQSYKVEMDAYVLPTQFMAGNETPQLQEWWQYLAYGTAIKILSDRLDMDGVQRIAPFFKEQQLLINRRNIVQQTAERTATIYSEQVQFPYSNNFNNFG